MSAKPKAKPKSSAERVAALRQRMRDRGYVAKTIWVPDAGDPRFAAEYDRQCRVISADAAEEREAMNWIEAVQADVELGGIPPFRLPDEK